MDHFREVPLPIIQKVRTATSGEVRSCQGSDDETAVEKCIAGSRRAFLSQDMATKIVGMLNAHHTQQCMTLDSLQERPGDGHFLLARRPNKVSYENGGEEQVVTVHEPS